MAPQGIKHAANHDRRNHEGKKSAQTIGHQDDAVGRRPVAQLIRLNAYLVYLKQNLRAEKPGDDAGYLAHNALNSVVVCKEQREYRTSKRGNKGTQYKDVVTHKQSRLSSFGHLGAFLCQWLVLQVVQGVRIHCSIAERNDIDQT